ncbi:MAG: excinuclease ABC subunit C [Chitinophagales bacterium]|nr:excinuclease ABC subunit C [Chitinophagales bacterium]
MNSEEFKSLYVSLPDYPGVYRFIDADGKLLYVGKAKNLKKRIASYFIKNHSNFRTQVMVRHAKRIEYTIVETEQDAFHLENSFIKNFQPRYNINMKDDKSYPFICIKNESFPRIFLTRRLERDGSEYFGPYTSVVKVRGILDFIKKMYPLRTCNLNLIQKNIEAGKFKVCLEFHIGNCKGPCEARESKEDYDNRIAHIRQILKGNLSEVIQNLKMQMQQYAEAYRFEEANLLKQKLDAMEAYQSRSLVVHPKITNVDVFSFKEDEKNAYVNCMRIVNGSVIQTQTVELVKKIEEESEDILLYAVHELRQQLQSNSKEILVPFFIQSPETDVTVTVPVIGDKKKLIDLSERNLQYYLLVKERERSDFKKETPAQRILSQLKKDFRLTEIPVHIECFDNSNFQGSFPVASLVVFKNAHPAKKEYRHFNIKTVEGPNDFASMEEIVFRRYKRLLDEQQPLPQLIMIDGGKGQLSAAMNSLEKLNLVGRVAVAGIAKRLEEIYFPGDSIPLYIDKKSPALRLIQQVRNEAHRFAITFHRNKRDKKTLRSELYDIKGVSGKTAEKLLRHFHSVEKIKGTPEEELIKVIGKSKARLIIEFFKPSVSVTNEIVQPSQE